MAPRHACARSARAATRRSPPRPRARAVVALALALAGLSLPLAAPRPAPADPPPRRGRCPAPRGVADLHVDLPFQVHYHRRAVDLRRPGGDVTAASLRAGCVRLLVLSIYLPSGLRPRVHTLAELLAVVDTADRIVRANPGVFAVPGAPVRVVYGIEGSGVLANALDQVPALVARGVRLFGLTHAHHNALADSATDPHPGRGGLTAAGERFVRAVHAAGALVDVSHASDAAFDDVVRLAREAGRPVVATHSNARALAAHPRNLTDAQLRALAATGGLVGLNFHARFLRRDGAPATVDDVVRHARHMLAVMGPGHLALGSDLDGEIVPAAGLETHAGLGTLAAALRRAGVAATEVRGVLGENAMRVIP